jgi:hypothetical protein
MTGMQAGSLTTHIGIEPGGGLVGRFGDTVILIPGGSDGSDADADAIRELLGVAASVASNRRAPASAIAARLAGWVIGRMSQGVPAFGIVAPVADGAVMFLRGAVWCTVTEGDGSTRELSGEQALTWVDQIVPGTFERMTIGGVGGRAVQASKLSDLRDGVVPGQGFVLTRVAGAADGTTDEGAASPKLVAVGSEQGSGAAGPGAAASFAPEPVPAASFAPEPVPAASFAPEPVPAASFAPEPVPAASFAPEPVPAEQEADEAEAEPAEAEATQSDAGAAAAEPAATAAEGARVPPTEAGTVEADAVAAPEADSGPDGGSGGFAWSAPADADRRWEGGPRDGTSLDPQQHPATMLAQTGWREAAARPEPVRPEPARPEPAHTTATPLPADLPPSGKPTALGTLTSDSGLVIVLDRGYVLGREPHLDPAVANGDASPVKLQDPDSMISRVHTYVIVDNGILLIRDVGSLHGTYISPPGPEEWSRLGVEPSPLPPGWRMRIGEQVFTFQLADQGDERS